MGMTKESSWSLDLEYEENNAFCTHCGLLGHTEGLCCKKDNNKGQGLLNTRAANLLPS